MYPFIDEQLHAELAADLFLLPAQLPVEANLLQLGLDSLRMMAWQNRLRARGYPLSLRALYRAPSVAGWSRLCHQAAALAFGSRQEPLPGFTVTDAEPSLPDDFSVLFAPLTLSPDIRQSAQHIVRHGALDALAHAIATLALWLGRPVRVIEVTAQHGCKNARGQTLLQQLTPRQLYYIGLISPSDLRVLTAQQADVICLHHEDWRQDSGDVRQLLALAAPGAMVHLLQCSPQQDSWLDYLQQQGLECQSAEHCGTQWRIIARVRPDLRIAAQDPLPPLSVLSRLSVQLQPQSRSPSQFPSPPYQPPIITPPLVLRPDPVSRHRPFALTDLQQAYLAGREPGFPLSGVGAHFFIEFDVDALDVGRFEAAWNRLIARHDMLRCVVRHGRQQVLVLEDLPRFALQHHQLDHLDGVAAVALRDRLAYQVRDPRRWPLFDLQAGVDGSGHSRLYLCLDHLMLDSLSIQILLAELEQLYLYPESELPALTLRFRDYQKQLGQRRPSQGSLAYWQARLSTLPAAPQLPLRCDPAQVARPHFVRLSATLPAARWGQLQQRAGDAGLTPSAVLLAAFSAVLSGWSRRPELTLSLSLCDRPQVDSQLNHLLGNFTSPLLLAWQPDGAWLSSACQLQRRLQQDLLHRDVSALWVMRQLARQHPDHGSMPVVFTCALGVPQQDFLSPRSCFRPQWGISQAPQIWLDHQVYESQGDLCFNWDAVQALFAPDVLCAMFDQYVALLERLAQDADAWQLSLQELIVPPSLPDHALALPPSALAAPEVALLDVAAQQHSQYTLRRYGRTGHLGRGGRGRRHVRSCPGGNSLTRGGENA
ncbi:aryl carrier-like protein [Herbaspirillum sp. Sphag1AN]|uniref:condensation domain-containing protein n=1 Tax=unclassified Herbaspirillum TaxID=2624150 RepID=UPI0018342385|nr:MULTISPECIES: condensation domain-containing protein [unclassified Herbaspirillum]MBB3212927.1 aryl carrier-like protein [Herbaspirillum sp. Sphag1AN]MBB3246124.1 aryl carrier-like protein [Herbaspirillum sp. Sphag64]